MNSILINDFIKISSSVNIIDIRSFEDYNIDHIPGAINIPFEKLLLYPNNYLLKNLKYYIYCDKGLSSSNVCSILNKQGFDTVSVDGGYNAWLLNKKGSVES